MPSQHSDDTASLSAEIDTGGGSRAWRAGLLGGVALTIIAIAAAVIVAGDFTGETPPEAPPTDELPDMSFGTTTTSSPEIIWPGLSDFVGGSPRCSWGSRSLHLDADIGAIGLLTVWPECWPGFGADELWWLAVSQGLADAWEEGGPEPWRRRLLAICTDLDTAVTINAVGMPLINPAVLAYALRRGLVDSFLAEGELAENDQAWERARLRWATIVAEDMESRAGLAWKYTALTATGLYCPEHQTFLRHHRDERLILETTVRRCATSTGGWCLRMKDVAATTRLLEILDAVAELEDDRQVARE